MSMGGAIASAASSGGQYSDLNSLGGLHYGAGLWNSADPLDLLGHSGSNIGANVTNPMGSGLINGNMPNNGVNPLEAQRWGATTGPTGLPAPAGPVNPLIYNPRFSYMPLSQGGAYNAMANALAQVPAGGGYNSAYGYRPNPAVPYGVMPVRVMPKGSAQP